MPEQTKDPSSSAQPEDAQSIPSEAQPLAPPVVQKRPSVRVVNPLQFLISILAIGGLVFLAVKGVQYFSTVQKEVVAALIAGTVALVGHYVVKHLERKRAIEQEIRSKKIPVYEEFLKFMFKFMKANKLGTPMSDEDTFDFFFGFNEKMVIWGSSDVIRAWSKFRLKAGERAPELVFHMEEVLRAIRKDTGHNDDNLKRGDLLMLFVNDLPTPDDE